MDFNAGYTIASHLTLTIIGLILLGVIIMSFRAEYSFLSVNRNLRLQFVLSVISLSVMMYLTLICLFHWSIPPYIVFMHILILVPILLVLAPIILLMRARAFKGLLVQRREDQKALIREVQELMDNKKEERIRKGKIERGEQVDK